MNKIQPQKDAEYKSNTEPFLYFSAFSAAKEISPRWIRWMYA